MTYDPEFNRLYIGTGNGGPWNRKIRSPGGGDNLFLCSVVALDADTGEYVWHYQTTPGDAWDYNSAMDMDPRHANDRRPAAQGASCTRPRTDSSTSSTGRMAGCISAEKLGTVTWATKVDLATGRPVLTPNARYENGPVTLWPSFQGAHNCFRSPSARELGLTTSRSSRCRRGFGGDVD